MPEFMKLNLRRFPVGRIHLGAARTALSGDTLTVNTAELQGKLLADPRLKSVSIEVATPGENCRVINVQDAIQPRCKAEGNATVFPGFLGDPPGLGTGVTHCLTGMAILSCGELRAKSSAEGPSSLTGPRNRIVDMSGPTAIYSAFSHTLNLVLTYQQAPEVAPQEFDAAIRHASLKAAEYLAATSKGGTPAAEEVWDLAPAPGLPRVAYIAQLQNDGYLRDTYLYGEVITASTMPTIIHPSELADGALVNANLSFAAVSTYGWQENQVVREMMRLHGKELDFAGVVLSTRHHLTDNDKARRAWTAAKLARQLGATGVVISQEGGGNSIIDQMLVCQACERMGMSTTVLTYEMGGPQGADFPLIYHVPEAAAIVSTGNREVLIDLPPVERALGGPRFLFADTPASGPYRTHVSDMAFAIDLAGFWRLQAQAY